MDTHVVVVGAGPVGLMLAGELRLGGVDVVVLERLRAPTGQSRASHLHARTMEVLDQRGLLDRLGEIRNDGASHFGGLPLDRDGPPTVYSGHWAVPQARTEAMLASWVAELGTDVRRGVEVVGLVTAADHVEVVAGATRLRARYVVGCDGEHSTVRRSAGFDFPGTAATRRLFRADVSGIHVDERRLRRYPRGVATAARRGGGVTRLMVHEFGRPGRDGGAAPAYGDVAAAWARVTGEEVAGATPIWVDAFDDASQQVTRYREDRVLLAGDAAHRQLPVGGQALNLGLQDAANLGWKLAAHVHGWAPAGLLDSYHDERHPVGTRVLTNVKAQTALLFGGPEVDPLRAVLEELLAIDAARTHLAGMISGLDIRYPVGPGGSPLLGTRIPHAEVLTEAGLTSTAALLHAARGLLLVADTDSARQAELLGTAEKWADRVRFTPVKTRSDNFLAEAGAMLVRPDGHIVWLYDGTSDVDGALRRWFGEPNRPIWRR